jgi:hypothetical protein
MRDRIASPVGSHADIHRTISRTVSESRLDVPHDENIAASDTFRHPCSERHIQSGILTGVLIIFSF